MIPKKGWLSSSFVLMLSGCLSEAGETSEAQTCGLVLFDYSSLRLTSRVYRQKQYGDLRESFFPNRRCLKNGRREIFEDGLRVRQDVSNWEDQEGSKIRGNCSQLHHERINISGNPADSHVILVIWHKFKSDKLGQLNAFNYMSLV